MRVVLFLLLAKWAAASSFSDTCLWPPLPPPRLTCGLDEISEQQILQNARSSQQKPEAPAPPPSKWESTGQCAGQYCIFANRGFSGGRGIVTITTNANIKTLKKLLDAPTAQRASPDLPSQFHLAQVKGKGLGLLANTTLHRGAPLMKIFPAVIIHRSFLEQLPAHSQAPLLESAIALLPPRLRQSFLSQMGHDHHHQASQSSLAHRISAILATNSFQLDLGGGTRGLEGHHYANFPEASRFNHDCRPNVAFYVDPATLAHTTTVARDVRPGEELSISYLDPLETRERRQERARQVWGFECGCAQCTLAGKEVGRSDARLKEIGEIEGRLGNWLSKGVNGKLLEKLVRLYKEERLEAKVGGAYTLVALNYNMLGDAKKAVKYAKLAEEAVLIENGPGAGDADAMKVLAGKPKGHFTWRKRLQGY
ncbi:SET domain-containing protein 5 [Madurella mycetomatis]|uniref:SET domain-containing protein 5 n=1 Tax=Madurella mycetomatis TaxID=100816 RepID=A0A175W691_9PEZI|nr:SET domain-containing protein 5 [Madurella mycetomatis]